MNNQLIIKAGKISAEVKKYARSFIKKNMPLLEIAEKIEDKIIELGGKMAFPTNLSINEIAAHYTPSYNDEAKAHGLLKIDLGVHVDGWIADTAFSLDLEDDEENKKLIIASQDALNNAIKLIENKFKKKKDTALKERLGGENTELKGGLGREATKSHNKSQNLDDKKQLTTNQIGKVVQEAIESKGFSPIINLSGHQIEQYELHAGLTIPNIDDKKEIILKKGLYAIEPFATNGNGRVYDGKPSGIYMLINSKNIRSSIAREVLEFILKEYYTIPFCSRWLVKKFGTKALFGLRQLEENGNLHQFQQLIETGKGKVAQTEHTILIEEDKIIVTSKED